MDPGASIPDVQIFIVLKWMVLIIITTGLMTWTSLYVKRIYYGGTERDRRASDYNTAENNKTILEHFLANQKDQTHQTNILRNEMREIKNALIRNGEALREVASSFNQSECKYYEQKRRSG